MGILLRGIPFPSTNLGTTVLKDLLDSRISYGCSLIASRISLVSLYSVEGLPMVTPGQKGRTAAPAETALSLPSLFHTRSMSMYGF